MGVCRICKRRVWNLMMWIFMGSNLSLRGGLGVLPQENLKIWSALGAILGIFYAYLGWVVKYNFPYKFTIFLCINNISLNKRILGDLYRFHVEKGALITDHVECKLPITFHGGTPNHVSRRKKDINHNSRWKFQANHASRGWPLPPPPPP